MKTFIDSKEPLSDDAVAAILDLHEETDVVDFKATFHPDEERDWLEITKDAIAFANTFGGYLGFGIKNGTYEKIGLDTEVVKILCDPNNVMQKVNRNVEPEMGSFRCKVVVVEGKSYVVVLIPPSHGQTHFVSKNASFKFQSGQEKTVLRKGTCYVRRSGANHLADARDFDSIIARRIEYFKSSLLDKIVRVVEAPQSSDVLVVTKVQSEELNAKFVVDDAPDGIPVKGMSFTVSPQTTEQEITAWIAMTGRDSSARPSYAITWRWYEERKSLKLSVEQRLRVACFCILNETPIFYWLSECKSQDIKAMLIDALAHRPGRVVIDNVLSVAAFLGKGAHSVITGKLGALKKKLSAEELSFPKRGPKSGFRADAVFPKSYSPRKRGVGNEILETELDGIAKSARASNDDQPALVDRWRAWTLDCFLYSRDDKYL